MPGLVVTPEELAWVVRILSPHFRVLTLSSAFEKLREGIVNEPLLALTFDDGQWDNYAYAVPVLREHGVLATFYLPVDAIESGSLLWHDEVAFAWSAMSADRAKLRRDLAEFACSGISFEQNVGQVMEILKCTPEESRLDFISRLRSAVSRDPPQWARVMTWSEAKQIAAEGHEIGSHGMSHRLLTALNASEQSHEISGSRTRIAARIGVSPASFCYPNGSFEPQTTALVGEAGYANAVTTQWGRNRSAADPFRLHRCDVDMRRVLNAGGTPSSARLLMRLSGLQPGLG
jgi:peptidoglycan/xylan/chitin deacetylase (PgdA/CDA1 family)